MTTDQITARVYCYDLDDLHARYKRLDFEFEQGDQQKLFMMGQLDTTAFDLSMGIDVPVTVVLNGERH